MEIKKRFEEILIFALKNNVSDIHFSLNNKILSIKMRSPLGLIDYLSKSNDLDLINKLIYKSNLDLSDKIHPQSGAFQYELYNRTLYFRFSIMYGFNNANFNLRILYQKVLKEKLSIDDYQNNQFENVKKADSGLILFSGPTGSGKTSSAYALLKSIKNKEIYTIEDPIEMLLENAFQIQVNPAKDLTYKEGIKALMRHDPDIVLIGEIRSENEALMAIRCALTGHLVVSTIHAKSAKGVINRLLDLGVNEFDLYETLLLITNQKLITKNKERLCLYEIMDQEEIEYYHKNQRNSPNFKSMGYYEAHILEK